MKTNTFSLPLVCCDNQNISASNLNAAAPTLAKTDFLRPTSWLLDVNEKGPVSPFQFFEGTIRIHLGCVYAGKLCMSFG